MICGGEAWEDIVMVGEARLTWFQNKGFLLNGIPSAITVARIIGCLNTKELQRCFINWIAAANTVTERQIIAIDGKRLRGSYGNKKGQSAAHMVSAFDTENGVVLGQIKTEDKSNEITAIPALLELLDIKGCLVTIDAMGCQED